MSKKCYIIEQETGEILNDNFVIDELEDQERKRKGAIKAKDFEEYKEIQSEIMGNFIFFLYKNMDKLKELLTDAEIVKYIYLATYTKKDGYLISDNNNTYIDKKKMQELLLLSKNPFLKFYNKLIKNKLLLEEKKSKIYKINIDMFWRGKRTDYKQQTGTEMIDYIRLYINATRFLYTQNQKNCRKLIVAYQLLPYTNWKYNVLCTDVKEVDKKKIKPLTIKDVMSILNYDKTHAARFKKYFYDIKYGENVLFKTIQDQPEWNTSIILVNPMFAYRNKNLQDLGENFNIFDINTGTRQIE